MPNRGYASNSPWKVCVLAAIATATSIGCERDSSTELVRYLEASRPLRARLSVSGLATPCLDDATSDRLIPIWRCRDTKASPFASDADIASNAIDVAATRGIDSHASGDRDRALILLVREPSKSIEAAIDALEVVSQESPDDLRTLTDLAAAYLTRAEVEDAPYEIVRALATLDRVLRVDPDLPAARYNRALALELLELRDAARIAWRRFLDVESDSRWSAEGAEHLDRLEAETLADRWPALLAELSSASLTEARAARLAVEVPQLARTAVEETRLRRWATAESADDRAHERAIIAVIGEAVRAATGDRWIEVLDAALPIAGASRAALDSTAAALLAYSEGRSLDCSWRLEDARSAFEAALERLAPDHPLRLSIRLHLGLLAYKREDIRAAERSWARLAGDLDSKDFTALQGHLGWYRGLCLAVGGDYLSALPQYESARGRFEAAGERDHAAAVEALIAEAHAQLGRDRAAWRAALRALRAADRFGSHERHYFVAAILGAMAWEQRQSGLALMLKSLAVDRAPDDEHGVRRADALVWRAWAKVRDGDGNAARTDLDAAQAASMAIGDSNLANRIEADIALVSGMIEQDESPAHAIGAFDSALRYFERSGLAGYALVTRLGRARARRGLGDWVGAREDLRSGLIEAAKGELAESIASGLDIGFEDPVEAMIEDLVGLEIDHFGTPRDALAIHLASRRRATAPTSWWGEPAASALEAAYRSLAPGHRLVIFADHEKRLLTWVLDREGVQWFHAEPITRADLADAIRSHARQIGRGRAEPDVLERLLLDPLEENLVDADRLTFIADGLLSTVPVAALRSPDTGRYLVEDHVISLATTLELDRGADAAVPPSSVSIAALVFGDPAFDEARVERLRRLDHAEAEARAVAAILGVTPYVGADADAATFLRMSPVAEIVHFAGHAVIHPRQPERSKLLMAPPPGRGGDVMAFEVARLDLKHCRLAVLSACSSSADTRRGSTEIVGVARAFLEAGADAVMGTLWPVDDHASSVLLPLFYRAYRVSGDAAGALREAQIDLLTSNDPALARPSAWAGYQIIDG